MSHSVRRCAKTAHPEESTAPDFSSLNLHVVDVLKSGSPAGGQCCVQWISGDIARSRPGREWFRRSRPSRFEQSVQQFDYRRAARPKIPLDLDSKSGRIRVEKVDSWALPAVAIG